MNTKDLMILLLGVMMILGMIMMIYQAKADKIYCDNRILYERSTLCGIPIYDQNTGRILIPNKSIENLTIDK